MSSLASSGGKQSSASALVLSLGVTLLIAVGCGSSQDVATEIERPVPERTPFLVGQVFFPDGEPAEEAMVLTEPFTMTVQADTQGVFRLYQELMSGDYQLVAHHARYPDERGQTAVTIGEEASPDSIYIVMGRSLTYYPVDMDTLNLGTCCYPTGCPW